MEISFLTKLISWRERRILVFSSRRGSAFPGGGSQHGSARKARAPPGFAKLGEARGEATMSPAEAGHLGRMRGGVKDELRHALERDLAATVAGRARASPGANRRSSPRVGPTPRRRDGGRRRWGCTIQRLRKTVMVNEGLSSRRA
jgi:hypothetical protein